MQDRQDAKADARKSAKAAPAADPETAQQALRDAERVARSGESHVNPVYRTQGEDHVHGENTHRDKDEIISEFDDPAANTVK